MTPSASAAQPAALETPPAAEYVDKLIPGASLLPDSMEGLSTHDASGRPRALRLESRAQSSSNDQGHESSAWVSLRGAFDTLNYGALSLDASARLFERSTHERRGAGASFSLYQTAVPFAGGWSASQGLGVIQTLSPRLAGQQASFLVPTRLVQGASSQWSNEAGGLTLQISGGETGSFSSIGQGSFYGSGNRVAAVGLQLQPAPAGPSPLPVGWRYSAVASTASGSAEQVVPGFGARLGEPAGSGLFQSLRWESPSAFVQGNLLTSRDQDLVTAYQGTSGRSGASHVGIWFDGALESGEISQRWGLHHLAPNLSWQGSALGGNSRGGYYRWSRSGLRNQVDAQVSSMDPVDAQAGGVAQRQAGVSVRHRIDQQLAVGGVVQVSDGTTNAVQISGYSELHRRWADLRLQAAVETSNGSIVVRRISSDQTWGLPIGQRLMTSQALSSTSSRAQDAGTVSASNYGTALELGVAGGADLGDRLTFDLNARVSLPLSTMASRLYNVSASSQWRLSREWSLGVVLSASRATGLTNTANTSPTPPLPGTVTPFTYQGSSSRDFWVTLRYDFQAGSSSLPIGVGARTGGGGGAVEGVVFLDENSNGRLDALEARVSNATVVLDGRYTTRTDAQGRFEFPFVAPGAHGVVVVSDTLPLPWVMPSAESARIDVAPRETTRLEIGATRDRLGAKPL